MVKEETKCGEIETQAQQFSNRAGRMHQIASELYSVLDRISGPRPCDPVKAPGTEVVPSRLPIITAFVDAGKDQDTALERLNHLLDEFRTLI